MLKFLFGKKEPKKESNPYTIKYFPITGRYIVMYNGNYLDTNPSSGFIREGSYPELGGEHLAEKFYSEDEAREYIKRHKEQTSEFIIINP